MLTAEQRFLVTSQLHAGRTVPQIHVDHPDVCALATLYRFAKDFSAGVGEQPKKRQQRPWKKIYPNMAATVVRRLTLAKTVHSIRSVARDIGTSHTAIQKLLKKKGVKCYKLRKRNLIPKAQQQKRKSCSVSFKKR